MAWEFFINVKAHINEAIFYSMLGNFQLAAEVLDTRWFFLYMGIYVFAMWDSYVTAIDLNKFSRLADRYDSPIMPFRIGALEVNYLDYRKPWSGVFWTLMTPGLGAVYANRLPTGFFVTICFVLTVYQSNVLPAVLLTFEGEMELAGKAINPQWFLNFPSILLTSVSSAYTDILFTNSLFKSEQSRYLKKNFQPKEFIMPSKRRGTNSMHFISAFQHSAFLELALSDLEQNGISKENIFVAPLGENSPDFPELKNTHTEASSKYELAFILGCVFMLLGSIYGFIWSWGPIIWALIGLVFGAILGLVLSFIFLRRKWFRNRTQTEVVLIIECDKNQSELVERVLWGHKALGVMKTS
ncbi:SLC41A family transporter [Neobacillus piezotolerans]|nr:magnesium transporter [Neobacillus piezotolerans]